MAYLYPSNSQWWAGHENKKTLFFWANKRSEDAEQALYKSHSILSSYLDKTQNSTLEHYGWFTFTTGSLLKQYWCIATASNYRADLYYRSFGYWYYRCLHIVYPFGTMYFLPVYDEALALYLAVNKSPIQARHIKAYEPWQ